MPDNLCYRRQAGQLPPQSIDTRLDDLLSERLEPRAFDQPEQPKCALRGGALQAPLNRSVASTGRRLPGDHVPDRRRRLRRGNLTWHIAAAPSDSLDPKVIDDFAAPMPITAAELDVIERYLADVLQDLLAAPGSIMAGDHPDQPDARSKQAARRQALKKKGT